MLFVRLLTIAWLWSSQGWTADEPYQYARCAVVGSEAPPCEVYYSEQVMGLSIYHEAMNLIDEPEGGKEKIASCVKILQQNGFAGLVKYWMKHEPEYFKKFSTTPLLEMVYGGGVEGVQYILDQGVDVNLTDDLGESPIHLAARKGYVNIMRLLIQAGANLDARDAENETPLDYAIHNKQKEIVIYLIRNKAKFSQGLGEMVMVGGGEGVQYALDQGVNLYQTDAQGKTPLHKAAQQGDVEVAKLLLQVGANINARDINNATPLDDAIRYNHKDMVLFLINYSH